MAYTTGLHNSDPPVLLIDGVLVVRWLTHVPFTSVTRVRFLLSAVIRLKFYFGRMWKECYQLTLPNRLRFPPVQTLDQ